MEGGGIVEQFLRKILVPIAIISGVVVVSGFFFPEALRQVVSGQGLLVVSLLFFGSTLGYLSVIPDRDGVDARSAEYFFRIQHAGLVQNLRTFLSRHDPVTFWTPVVALLGLLLVLFLAPSTTGDAIEAVRSVATGQVALLFIVVMLLSVVFSLYLLVGKWGDIRLGGSDAEPAYSYPVYFAMFFTAGMAAGIVFWGPAEAVFHYDTVPPFFDVEAQSGAAINAALAYSLFHWGFSAWSAYLVIGLPIAYFAYQWGAPLRVSSLLTPFLGVENLDSNWARLVDLLAIFATIGGIATSIALISQQFLAGIQFQWGVSSGSVGPLVFVTGLVLISVLSAQSGVHRGIRRIAAVSLVLFALFAMILLAIGPTTSILGRSSSAVSSYAFYFLPMSLFLGDGLTSTGWVANWTVWYWAWWFSWAPFAGLFLAALSRGRKLRTVVLTGLVATSVATMIWFLILGSTSLHLQHTGVADILAAITANSEAVAGFSMFEALPLSELLMFLFLGLIIVFMVSSADTSILVVAILATERDRSPTVATIVFWGVFQGVVALGVTLAGGEQALQTVAVLTGGIFAVLAVLSLAGLIYTFRRSDREYRSLTTAAREWYEEGKGDVKANVQRD